MELDTWQAPPGDTIPNNPSFPVLIYHGVAVSDPRALFAEHLGGCDVGAHGHELARELGHQPA